MELDADSVAVGAWLTLFVVGISYSTKKYFGLELPLYGWKDKPPAPPPIIVRKVTTTVIEVVFPTIIPISVSHRICTISTSTASGFTSGLPLPVPLVDLPPSANSVATPIYLLNPEDFKPLILGLLLLVLLVFLLLLVPLWVEVMRAQVFGNFGANNHQLASDNPPTPDAIPQTGPVLPSYPSTTKISSPMSGSSPGNDNRTLKDSPASDATNFLLHNGDLNDADFGMELQARSVWTCLSAYSGKGLCLD